MPEPVRVAVFASGGGTNLQALLDTHASDPPWRVRLVVGNRADAHALERARSAGVPAAVVRTREREPAAVAADQLALLSEHAVEVVALAGYMRLVPVPVVAAYRGRILNIHPALLPSFGGSGMYGAHVHRAVLKAGCRVSGATVHVVDEEYDRGRILAQAPVPVRVGDTPESLAARVLGVEHRLYGRVLDHVSACVRRGEAPGPLPVEGDIYECIQSKDGGR